MSLFEDFCDLFDGRRTHFGTEYGGSLAALLPAGQDCYPLKDGWELAVRVHLDRGGRDAIGVYPLCYGSPMDPSTTDGPNGPKFMTQGWYVHWGCVDFDEGEEESWVHAQNLVKVLRKVGVCGWIERSRSKGYHTWVFARRGEWVDAATVRRGLLVACQIAGAPTKEINPKSEGFDDPNTLGNYVRVCYPGWYAEDFNDTRRVVVDEHGEYIPLGYFLQEAHARAGLDGLSQLAQHWQPPVSLVDRIDLDTEVLEDLAPLVSKMTPLAHHIFVEGPLTGADRSGTLYKLAAKLYADGQHTYSEILALLEDYDRRHGKFYNRPDKDRRLRDIIERVWH